MAGRGLKSTTPIVITTENRYIGKAQTNYKARDRMMRLCGLSMASAAMLSQDTRCDKRGVGAMATVEIAAPLQCGQQCF